VQTRSYNNLTIAQETAALDVRPPTVSAPHPTIRPTFLQTTSAYAQISITLREETMAEQKLQGLRVAILATDLFEEAELIEPRKALDAAGARTEVIAPKSGEIQAVQHDTKTQKVKVDRTLDAAKADDFDAVLLPGGAMNADALRIERKAQEFVRHINEAKKPIAVICHGPWLLVSAGLAQGRKITSYKTIQDDLKNAGASWSDQEVVRDGNWVSSRQPSDLPAFNREMIALFAESRNRTNKAA
jgi:protease I